MHVLFELFCFCCFSALFLHCKLLQQQPTLPYDRHKEKAFCCKHLLFFFSKVVPFSKKHRKVLNRIVELFYWATSVVLICIQSAFFLFSHTLIQILIQMGTTEVVEKFCTFKRNLPAFYRERSYDDRFNCPSSNSCWCLRAIDFLSACLYCDWSNCPHWLIISARSPT